VYCNIINWLESHTLPCFYKTLLGIECPGCGMQRAFIWLLKGNLIESIKAYPALIPTIILFLLLILQLILKFKKGNFYIKIIFIFTVCLIVINYFYKICNHLLT
jgi:hypothetical protein